MEFGVRGCSWLGNGREREAKDIRLVVLSAPSCAYSFRPSARDCRAEYCTLYCGDLSSLTTVTSSSYGAVAARWLVSRDWSW